VSASRLEPLYRIRFTYAESWVAELEGGREQHLFLAVSRCEGAIAGRFRGANFPQRRTAAGLFCPDYRGAIETDDGATITFECHGYGGAHPVGRRQIVGSVLHLSESDRIAVSTTWCAWAWARCARPRTPLTRTPGWCSTSPS
jgi:hypothetical protein